MKKNNSPEQNYLALLDDIKHRIEVINALNFKVTATTNFKATDIETCCLQIRMILEAIAFGSLASNYTIFCNQYKKYSKNKNVLILFEELKKINTDFYPQPIIEVESSQDGIFKEWLETDKDYLKEKDFINAYELCGHILHAENPYGKRIDYDLYKENIKIWTNQIINLLNVHLIKFVGGKNLNLYHMNTSNNYPTCQPFGFDRLISEDINHD